MQEQQPSQTYPASPSLYSQNVKIKGKTYFFDVKEAKNGNKYLKISESWLKNGLPVRGQLTVFKENLQDFSQAISEAAEKAM